MEVALFDLDPQGNATVALQGMFAPDAEADPLIQVCERLRLLPSPGAKAVLEHQISVDPAQLAELAAHLSPAIDWLLVDCPPRLDAWGWAGLQLCEQVLVPVQAEFFSMHGLSQMIAALETAAVHYPGRANLLGVVPTMVDTREPLAQEVLEDLRRNLGGKVTRTVVLRDSMLVEAASHGKTAFEHCPDSVGALCYTELVKEIIDGGA